MKNPTRKACTLLCALMCTFFSNFVYSQQTLTQINGWNAYVHLPASYNSGSASYPTIIFFPGLGEVGTNAAALISNGPGAYIAQGWNGNVTVNGSTVEFIVISLQPPSAYPGESVINDKIQKIKSLYRVDNNRLYLTGLSHGGWCSNTFVTGDAYGGPYNYASQIAAVVEVEGVIPDDNSPYPNLFDNFANSGGRLLGFEQLYDNRGMPTRVNRMNATRPNSAIYVQTNFGGGGHCCWNQFYGGQGVQPGNFMLDGVSQNLYQWLARQSRSGTTPPPANQAPVANAGADKTITLPTSSVTLTGSGTDADGTIASYQWTKVSGNGGTIASATSAATNITGLTQGSYTFQLKVTDNAGATATDNVVVTVNAAANAAPTANAGSNQTITLPASTVTLSGSGTDTDGTIASYQWTKISGTGGTITSSSAASTTVTGLTQGSYTFQLKVTDNAGATATANVSVTVNAATAGQTNSPSGECNTSAPVVHLLSQTGPGEIYRPNGSTWKGGDTVKITGTSYSVIEFYNVAGDPCRPIVIMPMTTVTTPVFRIKGNSRYLKIWGGKTQYGIKVNGGPIALTSCHHIEVDNVETTGGSTGVYCKQDVVYADTMTWHPNYRMTKFTFKNMWIHDVDGEGMYIGITQPSGLTVRSTWSGLDTVIVPIRLDSVEISNNIVERCTWDGIQLSNARNGNKIFGNTVRDYGTINKSSQQAGIILGGNCNGDVYNNNVSRGTGNGIQVFGYGVINVYGNTVDSCGYDGVTNSNGTQGQQSIYVSDFLNGVEVNPKQTVNLYNNAVNHPKTASAIFITGYYNNSNPSSVYNNTFCIPGAPANWQSTYLKLNVAGSTNSNNILSCTGASPTPPNVAPAANAGADQTITLPTATVTLNGSGTDTDGSVVSYAWAKVAGGAATIATATAASTAVSGLVQGVYKFELTVTDNGGLTAKDTVQVTVNATAVTLLPAVNPANTVNGLDYKYYEGNWSVLPNFATLTPVKAGTVPNFDISLANRTDQMGFSFTGYINVPADGEYTFYTTSDDGSKLYIDAVQVVDNDGLHASQERSGVIGLKAGKHAITGLFFEQGGGEVFTVSYASATITKQQIPAASLYRVNSLPVANAGANQNITTASGTLTGSGTDSDGTIVSYQWTKVSGPDGTSFGNANAASTTVNGLVQGTYVFQLKVTDNAGAVAAATTQVTVTIATGTGKAIRVNVFGGTNPSTDAKWNNWNIGSAVNSSNFLYEDRTSSTVKASIAGDIMVVDNGTGYATGATTPAAAILRYNSASTSQRNLTLKGLNPSKKYTIEFYASRKSTGNQTLYMIGNRKDTINTDNNVNDYAKFTDISADASGTVTVNISRIGVWNYLAGFSIIEQGTAASARGGEPEPETVQIPQVYKGEDIVETNNNAVSVYPNPFSEYFKVQLNNKTTGEFVLKLTSQAGQTVYYKKVNKTTAAVTETINVSNLAAGTYVLQIISVATGNQTVHKVIRN